MKIAFVSGRVDSEELAAYAANIARGLLSAGHSVRFVCPGGSLAWRVGRSGVEVMEFPRLGSLLGGRGSARGAAGALSEFGAQVLHVLGIESWRIAAGILKNLDLPAVVSFLDFLHGRRLPWRPGSWPVAVVPSEPLRENLVNEGGMPKTRVAFVRTSVDPASYPPKNDSEPGSLVPPVGCVSRLARGKGLELFLEAAGKVLDSGREVEFLLAGEGPEEARLRRLASSSGVRRKLAFVGNETDPVVVFRNLDVFVLPCPREALGITVLEAMACARPVVAAAGGVVSALVRDGENGLLAPPGDADALARNIIKLVDDAELRRDMGRAGREIVVEEFRSSEAAASLLEVYGRAVSERKA